MSVDNATGDAQLAALIERVRQLPGMIDRAAPDCARAVEAEMQRTIAAGTTAYGVPWKPTRDGDRPLQHAADALKVGVIGRTIYIRIVGPEARHHRGIVKGGVARPIIPINKIPAPMAAAITRVLTEHFQAAVSP